MNDGKVAAPGCPPCVCAGGFGGPQKFNSFQPHDLSFQTLPDAQSGIRGFKIKVEETNMQPSHSLLQFLSAKYVEAE